MRVQKKGIINLAFLMVISISNCYSFDFNSYQAATFDDVISHLENVVIELEKNPKLNLEELNLQFVKYKLTLNLPSIPIEITNIDLVEAKAQGKTYFGKEEVYTYQFRIDYKKRTFIFYFQGPLMKYLPSEKKIGQKIELYCGLVKYKKSKNEYLLLVNEFN